MKKNEMIDYILGRLYYKPSSWFYKYLGITEEAFGRITNLKSWLNRQNLASLEKIYRRLK